MKKQILIIGVALVGTAALAQEQNRQTTTQPGQTQTPPPATAPARTVQPTETREADRTDTGNRLTQGLSNIITDWRLEDLPPAVQKTVREQAQGRKIEDIDRESRTGQTIWEIEFERDGVNHEIHVADDGTLIPDEQAGLLGRTTTRTQTATGVGAAAGAETDRSRVNLGFGTQWEDLPQAVQQKAMQFGGKDKVADIDRENWQGKTAYEIEFKREGQRNLELLFSEDGSVLESSDPSVAPVSSPTPGAQGQRVTPPATQNQRQTQPGQTQPAPGQQNQQNQPQRTTTPGTTQPPQ